MSTLLRISYEAFPGQFMMVLGSAHSGAADHATPVERTLSVFESWRTGEDVAYLCMSCQSQLRQRYLVSIHRVPCLRRCCKTLRRLSTRGTDGYLKTRCRASWTITTIAQALLS